METTADGSSPPATVNDTEESSAHHHHQQHSSSADVTDRSQTDCRCAHRESRSGDVGEVECFPGGSCAQPRFVLGLVTESSSPACTGTGKTHTVSDGICTDRSGNGLSRSDTVGGDGSLEGHAGAWPALGGRGGMGRAGPDSSQSSPDRTVQHVRIQDGRSSTEQLDAVCCQTEASCTEGSQVNRYNGLDGGGGPGSEAHWLPSRDCLSKGDTSSDGHPGIRTGDSVAAELPNGRSLGRAGLHPLDTPSSPSAGEGWGPSQTDTDPSVAPLSSSSTSQGTIKQTPPSSNVDTAEKAEEEEASDLGRPAPAPRSLPCSVSYNSPPPSPESRLEAGSDDAFAEPHPGQQQGDRRFVDVSLGSRNTYECSRRQSAPGQLPQGGGPGGEASDLPLQSRRPGIVEYFGSRKQRSVSQGVAGWKLFGKVPPRESPTKDARTIQQERLPVGLTSVSSPDLLTSGEYEVRQSRTAAGNSPTQHAVGRSRKNLEFEPLSTTALILEDRPANLPAKSAEEAQRHRQEYDQMVAAARRRELKELQRKQKQMKERFKQEESIASAMVVWTNDILPHWDAMRSSRRARDLWWQGLPPNVRGRVWSLAIGNELNITPELYGIFLSRAKEKWRNLNESGSDEADDGAALEDRESSLELITLDISRTFPALYFFQKGGPYHDLLQSILGAYTCYRPDVGYVQGMSFIAAVLILNLQEADAFISFSNLINKPCQMAFFRVDHPLMLKYFGAFEVFFEESLPRLFLHFQSLSLTPDLYLIDWIFSLYTKPLPLDVACRVWDVFCRDGEEFLFRTGLGILRLYQDVLLQMDFIHIAQFLARLPDEELLSDRLFSCIAATPMLNGNRKWNQVFTSLMKDTKEPERNAS